MIPLLLFGAFVVGAVVVASEEEATKGWPKVRLVHDGDWSWVSGDTYVLRHSLSKAGFRWSKKRQAWYLTRTVDPLELARLLPEEAVVVFVEKREVVPFREREREREREPEKPGHRGELVGLPGSDVPEISLETLLRSTGIRFGTTAPYRIDEVFAARKAYIGHDVPAILINGAARESGDATPIAKQLAYRYADTYGYSLMGHVPNVRIGRTRMLKDDNPSSPSLGRTKRMEQMQWVFEIVRPTMPYRNPETGAAVGEQGFEWWPPDEYAYGHPALVRWKRPRIWKEMYGKEPSTFGRQFLVGVPSPESRVPGPPPAGTFRPAFL